MPIDQLYTVVERELDLDPDDEKPPTHKGQPVADQAWKRNLRNALQAEKRSYRLVNVEHGSWGLPRPNPSLALDPTEAWPLVASAAAEAIEKEVSFASPVQGKTYRVSAVDESGLEVQRTDSGSVARVTRGDIERAVGYVNAAGGQVGRRTLHYTVAKEEAIVQLHPDLQWDDAKEWIVAVLDTRATPSESSIDPTLTDATHRPRRYWALLANPTTYRIEEAVRALDEDWWTTKGKALAPGDGIVIWKAGGRDSHRGVVAFGTVAGQPERTTAVDSPFWVDPADGERIEPRVRVQYEVTDVLPLWMGEGDDGVLSTLSVSRARGGTVFHVSEQEWAAVRFAADAGEGSGRKRAADMTRINEVEPLIADQPLIAQVSPALPTKRGRDKSGSRIRRSRNSKAIGDRAEAVVVQHLRRTLPASQQGSVRWVAAEGERPGWDVQYVDTDGELVAVEVKGTTGEQFVSVEVTANEWAAAEAKGTRYHLYLVARCTSKTPVIEVIEDPASSVKDGRFGMTPSVWKLEARAK